MTKAKPTTLTQALSKILQQAYSFTNPENTIHEWKNRVATFQQYGQLYDVKFIKQKLPALLRLLGLQYQTHQIRQLTQGHKREICIHRMKLLYLLKNQHLLFLIHDRTHISKLLDQFELNTSQLYYDKQRYQQLQAPIEDIYKRTLIHYIDTDKFGNKFEKIRVLQRLKIALEYLIFLQNKHHAYSPIIDQGIEILNKKASKKIKVFYSIITSKNVFTYHNFIRIFIEIYEHKYAFKNFSKILEQNKKEILLPEFKDAIQSADIEKWLQFIFKLNPKIEAKKPSGQKITRDLNKPFLLEEDLYTDKINQILELVYRGIKDKLDCDLKEWTNKFKEENTPPINWTGKIIELKSVFILLETHERFKILKPNQFINKRISEHFTINQQIISPKKISKDASKDLYTTQIPFELALLIK